MPDFPGNPSQPDTPGPLPDWAAKPYIPPAEPELSPAEEIVALKQQVARLTEALRTGDLTILNEGDAS